LILYVNGDSHTAGAEAVNPHAWAQDDRELFHMGRAPHPANLAVSWGQRLATSIRASFHCGAQAGGSNARILRTTRAWLDSTPRNQDLLVIIQWSTWEREEWPINGEYYQVNASGIDEIPTDYQPQYKEFIANLDWNVKTEQAHNDVWAFHTELKDQNIPHIFFNGNNDFSQIKQQKDWGSSYISPYDSKFTFNSIIRAQGIDTVAPNSWHFGRDGHSYFHRFMLQYIIKNKLI
jgi:hypothetical protein